MKLTNEMFIEAGFKKANDLIIMFEYNLGEGIDLFMNIIMFIKDLVFMLMKLIVIYILQQKHLKKQLHGQNQFVQ